MKGERNGCLSPIYVKSCCDTLVHWLTFFPFPVFSSLLISNPQRRVSSSGCSPLGKFRRLYQKSFAGAQREEICFQYVRGRGRMHFWLAKINMRLAFAPAYLLILGVFEPIHSREALWKKKKYANNADNQPVNSREWDLGHVSSLKSDASFFSQFPLFIPSEFQYILSSLD